MTSAAKKAFARFYKTPVEIYRLSSGSDYSSSAERELVCSVLADIQPFSGELSDMEYGLDAKRRFKMYCADCEGISEGGYVKVDGVFYQITYAERWEMGIAAVIERVCQDED